METYFDSGEAEFYLRLMEMMPATSTGKPMQLLGWEQDAIREFYGRMTTGEDGAAQRLYQYLYLELTKKQGKTELAAGLGIGHLMDGAELSPEVYIVAADRENASICFRAACFKIRNTPYLAKLEKKGVLKIRESTKTIRYAVNNGIFRVMSADAEDKHGYKPSCVIFDELHAQPNRKLWDVMTFGAGDARRQPVWIVLTTAGDDPDRRSIGWEVHSEALGVLKARKLREALDAGEDVRVLPFLQNAEEATLQQSIDDILALDKPRWLPVMYGVSALCWDDDDALAALDIYDENLWRQVNPSVGTTVKLSTIREEAQEAKKSEAKERLFRWLRLNQWIATKTVGWIPLTLYDKTQWHGETSELAGKKCYGGLDLSSTGDLTAFVLFFPAQKDLPEAVFLPWAWVPGDDMDTRERLDGAHYRDWERAHFMDICEGNVIDYEAVKDKISEAAAKYDLRMLGTDPYLSRTITQELAEPMPGTGRTAVQQLVEIPQTIAGMWPAMWEIEVGIKQHTMLHVHNTAARYCFGNVRCRGDGNGNLKPMKNLSRGRIDITVAGINAVAAWLLDGGAERTLAEAIDTGWTL